MKKLMVLALVATLLMAGAAFAAGKHVAAPNATFAFGVIPPGGTAAAAAGPTTTNNDDSCDIGVTPAATLLLPYFEVDFASPQTTAQTTLFTITNVSEFPQIAKVTLWTDYSFPVLDFNLFLTGYDVQAINLYDVIGRGIIASTSGTSVAVTPGALSLANTANPNFGTGVALNCAPGVLPGRIPPGLLTDLRSGLTTGTVSGCGTSRVGGTHSSAIGYATIDVVNNCTQTLPSSGTYYASEILFDNVLIGDYQQINPNPATGNYAGGNPLVHIRAIPEGGPAGATPTVGTVPTNFPYTFYSRYIANFGGVVIPFRDRRQPLPATFAARFIEGGTGNFNTNYKIWREGREGTASCTSVGSNTSGTNNRDIPIAEIVRFDEHENPTTYAPGVIISPGIIQNITLPETSSSATSNLALFPPLSGSGDVGGWMYLNLNSSSTVGGVNTPVHPLFGPRASQNWVIVSMSAEGRYSVDFDAAWLGNGCNPAVGTSEANNGAVVIGPTGGTLVCPPGFTGGAPAPCVAGTPAYNGTNTTP
jgi:hypothetical protein